MESGGSESIVGLHSSCLSLGQAGKWGSAPTASVSTLSFFPPPFQPQTSWLWRSGRSPPRLCRALSVPVVQAKCCLWWGCCPGCEPAKRNQRGLEAEGPGRCVWPDMVDSNACVPRGQETILAGMLVRAANMLWVLISSLNVFLGKQTLWGQKTVMVFRMVIWSKTDSVAYSTDGYIKLWKSHK